MVKNSKNNFFPDANKVFPLPNNKSLCFLKNIIKRPNIEVGDFSYYFDSEDVYNFEKNVLYHYEVLQDKLIIGKFCQIGMSVKFIMNGGNHKYCSFNSSHLLHTFPRACSTIPRSSSNKRKKDTVVCNDVWIGCGATIFPGVKIGNGSIISHGSVVTKDVLPYTIVAGQPATEVKTRFDKTTIDFLEDLQWWNWPIEKIISQTEYLNTRNIQALKKAKIEVDLTLT
ncbi:CatB-related O-acetyltransferase [Candidatus Megaera polyxenophila]|nr:CatB-related O-acetyltransferase [Candidatus Megaera polyxenophila]